MKKSILFGLLVLLLTACGGNTQKNNEQVTGTEAKEQVVGASTVNVYYSYEISKYFSCFYVRTRKIFGFGD